MDFSTRSTELELIDQGPDAFSREEYRACLMLLGRNGRLLGGDRAGLKAFRSLRPEPDSILDVGCGAGWFARILAGCFPKATVRGEDISEEAIALAKELHTSAGLENLSFSVPAQRELVAEPKSVDVVTATLVCHHMEDDVLVDFLQRARRIARRAVIINDLHRHPLAYYSFALTQPLLFPNRLIRHDGLLSIRRSFTRADWEKLLKQAGISGGSVRWHGVFRWIVQFPGGEV